MVRLRVLSWNVHWGVAHVPGRPRNEGFDPLAELGPDVLGAADVVVFPEAWRAHDGCSFLDGLAEHGLVHVAETRYTTLRISGADRRRIDDPGEGWWELAIATRHPIVADRELAMAHSIADAVPVRHARSVRIRAQASGGGGAREIDLTAFHVSSKLWFAAPVVQLRSLARLVAAAGVDGRERPAVLVGDANLWRTCIPFVLPGWRSTTTGATFPSWRPHSQIDHILVRGAVEPVGGEVLAFSRTSDHRAIVADLQLR